ncbi:unnamed protein product [Mesocestoides corti]|uniref:Uncharacterized protein n=1 Tax=Mesocestoides corti TaxID=53468 RepID=A0A0R3UP77_MESCO|nr:unnamed protein product [Mesocestoides corti]
MASEYSVAVWDRLPTISGSANLVTTGSFSRQEKSELEQTQHAVLLKPVQKHIQTIEGKRAMLVMDTCITKVLLVSALPQIVANMKNYEVLLGRKVTLSIREYERVALEYEAAVKASAEESNMNRQELHLAAPNKT